MPPEYSANVAKASLHIAERAWLSVTFDRPFQPTAEHVSPIEFTVRNVGKTVAKLKAKSVNGMFWPHGFIPARQLDPKPTDPLPAIAMIFPGDALILDGLVDILFTQKQIDGIRTGDRLFDVYGYVVYDDVFNNRHITRFCQVYDTTANGGRGGFTFPREAQAEYNEADY